MEASGRLSPKVQDRVPELCVALCQSSSHLLAAISDLEITPASLADLTLLTLGPQFRGGANNVIGSGGVKEIADLIRSIVARTVQADVGKTSSRSATLPEGVS